MTKAFQLTPEVLEEAEECGALGLTYEQTALCLGMSQSSLLVNRGKFAGLSTAIERGRARGIRSMTGNLRNQAEDGNTHATMFYLRNMSSDTWNNDSANVAKIQVNLARISDSELLTELREDPALLQVVNARQLEGN